MVTVADPGSGDQDPLPLLKLVKKKMAATWGRKFRESSGPPRTNFWIRYWVINDMFHCKVKKIIYLTDFTHLSP